MFINGKEFLTVRDMAERLNKNKEAVKKLLHNAGQKPISRDALYPVEAFNAIKDAPGKGRPKKSKILPP
jgi:benzoyl-CoA reductase/2-hydroxyglutaryl-CoA dehydratase subunit BcrC/BadD/HgdB